MSVVVLIIELEESHGWVQEMVTETKILKVGNGSVEGIDVGEYKFVFVPEPFR